MPLEPLPWGRKEFIFKERKYETNSSFDAPAVVGGGGGGDGSFTPRWREPYCRSSPRRPPPGYHRLPVIYHQLNQESNGHGFMPPRSSGVERFWPEEERRYGRRCRGGSFRGSSPYYNSYDIHVTAQRSVAVPINSPPPSKDPMYDQQSGGYDQRPDRDRDRENSLGPIGWKPRLTFQGSGDSSRMVRLEIDEFGVDMVFPNPGKETLIRFPVSSPVPVDVGLSRKKPRLGWGQGLAKYEKQKVEVSGNSGGKDQVSETSPKAVSMAGSRSPATPCSAACTSPAGMEDMLFSKTMNMGNDTFNFGDSFAFDSKNLLGELSINRDHLPPGFLLL